MGMSNYLETKWLNTIRGFVFMGVNEVYVGLFTTPGTDLTPGTEPSDSAYSRQLVTFSEPVQESDKAVIKNTAELSFNPATENWGTISHFGLFDASTGGNYLFHGEVNTAKTVETDDQLKIQANELTVSLE
ncbi:phage tail fiber protein [Vallitalea maricola]|uniref:Uncharacterized protein n=1 Tax=Vallitalea maricola TaxID=3074433 RepID=A0ACB5UF99_9FIRM|nr:hypothetical protein AN2V17_04360 [Vallitalea sp. AN17-2]